jgi:23S rRNA (adenine2030-N6)-methyltransferase
MDYAHARHAGNAGDVLKHVALIAALEELKPERYFETHAGDGLYPLGSNGEWSEGVQRVFHASQGLVGKYAAIVRSYSSEGATRPGKLPGSPLIAARYVPRPQTILYEIDPRAASLLRRALPEAEVRESDGLALTEVPPKSLVLIDPPYTQKQEWTDSARTASRLFSAAALLHWYPIKALTRPRALLAELAKLGVHGVAVELHWTPLRLKREKLNGSGVIFAGEAVKAVPAFLGAIPELGSTLQTHGEWSSVQIGF